MTVSHVSATADLNAATDVLVRAAEIVAHATAHPCNAQCMDATSKVCDCTECYGANHGAGWAEAHAKATHEARQRDLRAGGTISRLVAMGAMVDTEDGAF